MAADRASVQRASFAVCFLLVLLLPNDVVMLQTGGLTIYLTEALVWLGFSLVLALHLVNGSEDPISRGLVAFPEAFLYMSWCALAALLVLGLLGSTDTIGKVRTAAPGLMLALLVIRHTPHRRQAVALCLAIIAGAAVNGTLGLLQIATGEPYPVPEHENNIWKTDIAGQVLANTANGLFATPNNLGTALAPAAVIGLRLGLTRIVALPRSIWIATVVATVVAIVALYATQNRGALLFFLAGAVIAFAPVRHKVPAAALVVGGVLALLVVIGARPSAELGLGGADTLATRLRLWWAAWITVNEHSSVLLFGGGQSAMESNTATYAGWRFPTAHNGWLDQLLLFGLPALLLYLLVWAAALAAIKRRLESVPITERIVLQAVLGALAALAGLLALEPRAEGVFPVGQVFLLFGLALSGGLGPPSQADPGSRNGEQNS